MSELIDCIIASLNCLFSLVHPLTFQDDIVMLVSSMLAKGWVSYPRPTCAPAVPVSTFRFCFHWASISFLTALPDCSTV